MWTCVLVSPQPHIGEIPHLKEDSPLSFAKYPPTQLFRFFFFNLINIIVAIYSRICIDKDLQNLIMTKSFLAEYKGKAYITYRLSCG